MALINGGFELAQSVVTGGVAIGLAFFAYRAITALAGTYTGVSLGLHGLDSALVGISVYFIGPGGVAFGAGCFMLYRRERQKRFRAIRHLGQQRLEAERQIDPQRSSSGLTPDGRTHPDDV